MYLCYYGTLAPERSENSYQWLREIAICSRSRASLGLRSGLFNAELNGASLCLFVEAKVHYFRNYEVWNTEFIARHVVRKIGQFRQLPAYFRLLRGTSDAKPFPWKD